MIATSNLLRKALLPAQSRLAQDASKTVVFDGRDIGTVVFPEADIKIFLTATLESRAERRLKQLTEKNIQPVPSLDGVINLIRRRDDRDENRQAAPLRKAKDAIVARKEEKRAAKDAAREAQKKA